MYKVTVHKEGSSFTGGLYPVETIDTHLDKLESMGYTIVLVERNL